MSQMSKDITPSCPKSGTVPDCPVQGHVLSKYQHCILPPSHAKAIRELWNQFHQIYLNLKSKSYNPQQFQFEAEDWLQLFLTPNRVVPNSTHIKKGLYNPSAITPYMHVLVYHISEFMEKHQRFGMKAFSCAPVEKKNYQQVTNFFQQTFKDGGMEGR